jgi:putative addiction module killer protein
MGVADAEAFLSMRANAREVCASAHQQHWHFAVRQHLCGDRAHDEVAQIVIVRLQCAMISVKALPDFSHWMDGLPDAKIKAIVAARIRRLSLGLAGDVAPVGDGVSELRIHVGAGWRVYFVQRGTEVIVLLAGGSKRSQAADIRKAKTLAKTLD